MHYPLDPQVFETAHKIMSHAPLLDSTISGFRTLHELDLIEKRTAWEVVDDSVYELAGDEHVVEFYYVRMVEYPQCSDLIFKCVLS